MNGDGTELINFIKEASRMASQPWISHYDRRVPPALAYPEVPVFHFLDEAARRCPARACIVFRDETLTYARTADLTGRLASALRGLGLRKGDRVGIFMPNGPEFILAYFAILKAGGVVVAIHPLYTCPEIARQVNDAGIETIFCAGPLYERLQAARPGTGLRRVIVTGEAAPRAGDLRFGELQACPSAALDPVSPQDVALLQYTGGTNGVLKGAVALHRNLVANILQFKAWLWTLEEDQETFLLALPAYHVYGMVGGMLFGMALRATLVVLASPRNTPELLNAIQTRRITYFPAVPTLFNAINDHPEVAAGKARLSSIKVCLSGAAPLTKETRETFERLTGGRIVEGFGLSEAPAATHCNPLQGENRAGSIGLPLSDVEARIVSRVDGVTELPAGEAGELILRGPQVMQGYHNMPGETAVALRRGWLHTGDIARMDAEGYFYIVGRKKDLIKPGGLQVWPREVEEAIAAHPAVADVVVAGAPNAYRGETVRARVALKAGQTLDTAGIKAWCRERLAPFKIPTEIEFRVPGDTGPT